MNSLMYKSGYRKKREALLAIEKYIFKPEKRKNAAICILWQVFDLLCVKFGWVIFIRMESEKESDTYYVCLTDIAFFLR